MLHRFENRSSVTSIARIVTSIQDTQKIVRSDMLNYTNFCGNIVSWQVVRENCSV